jgi:hypothetical protein
MKRRDVLKTLGVAPVLPFFPLSCKKYNLIELYPKRTYNEYDNNDLLCGKYCYYKVLDDNDRYIYHIGLKMHFGGVPSKELLNFANNYKYLYKICQDPFYCYYLSNQKIEELSFETLYIIRTFGPKEII